jgi:hypothetical protein
MDMTPKAMIAGFTAAERDYIRRESQSLSALRPRRQLKG